MKLSCWVIQILKDELTCKFCIIQQQLNHPPENTLKLLLCKVYEIDSSMFIFVNKYYLYLKQVKGIMD